MSRYKSELRPPDAKRSKGERSLSPAGNTNIPVFERRKMFEETDGGDRLAIGKRTGRFSNRKSEIPRSSSFRISKKMKTEDGSPLLRTKQISSSGLWQRLRSFGHFDMQSMTIERLSTERALNERNVKKATGASAAHYEDVHMGDGVHNELVASCPAFKNEVGGDSDWLEDGNRAIVMIRESLSHEKQKRVGSRERLVLDGEIPTKDTMHTKGAMSRQAIEIFQPQLGMHYPFEFIDYGASYYRNYFLGTEHQNFFGVDENLGPIAISLKRERIPDELTEFYNVPPNVGPIGIPKHLYRIILRTSELATLRGSVLEESVPSGTKAGTSKGLPARDVVDFISQGEVQLSCLRLSKQEKKVQQELVRLDEQELNNKYKIGVLYCKKGQTSEEEMYNNEQGSAAFDEFLELLGKKVKMRGFTKYRAQLDHKTDTTGEYSVYSEYRDAEVMFHVSTLLPYTPSNKQQLLRKRHIGNDIVTVIFQEPGCEPFSAKAIRSQFQHIFVVVNVENPKSAFTKYRVAVTRSQDIPYFGPAIPEGAVFDKNQQFKEFLLTKLINACNASLRSDKFSGMATRTRKQYLIDLAENNTSSLTIDQANATGGLVAGFLSKNWGGRKRERTRQPGPLHYTPGALTWNVYLILREGKPLPFSEDYDYHLDCILGVAPDMLVFVDAYTKDNVLHIPTKDIVGWVQDGSRLNLFYDDCYCVCLESYESEEDVREICSRLLTIAPMITSSHEATLMEFSRGINGLLGFGINEAGVVQKVAGQASHTGLQVNSRLLQVEDRLLCCHTHVQIMELLTAKFRHVVKAYVVPPPPSTFRSLLYYPPLNWSAVWTSRPSHNGDDDGSRTSNGPQAMDASPPLLRRKASNTNRRSYIEAVGMGNELSRSNEELQMETCRVPYDDDEPLYDRLINYDPNVVQLRSKSPRPQRGGGGGGGGGGRDDKAGFTRVRRMRAVRESVVHFADDLLERQLTMGGRNAWTPEPTEHTIDVYSPHVRMEVATSTTIPKNKPKTAAPLSKLPGHRRAASGDHKRPPHIDLSGSNTTPKSDMPMTPGQVHELTKRFSFTPSGTGHRATPSKIPVATGHGTPMRATAAATEMTKSSIPQTFTYQESKKADGDLQLRSGKKGVKVRPMSWDASLIFNGDKEHVERSKDDSTSDDAFEQVFAGESFTRNSNIRSAFRKKSSSREFSPEPANDDVQEPQAMEDDRPSTAGVTDVEPSAQEPAQVNQKTPSQRISVRERTKKWEARGGGVPSYFSTLPKSFRHKATSVSTPSSTPPYHSHTLMRTSTGLLLRDGLTKSAGPPRDHYSASKIPSPRTQPPSGSKGRPGGGGAAPRSLFPNSPSGKTSPDHLSHREDADGSSNPDEALLKSLEAEGQGKDDATTEKTSGQRPVLASQTSSESLGAHQPLIKRRNVTVPVGKSRGKSLLPTKTQMRSASQLPASHPVAQTVTSPGQAHTDGVEEKTTQEGGVSSPTFKAVSNVVILKAPERSSNIPRPTRTSDSSEQHVGNGQVHTGVVRGTSAPSMIPVPAGAADSRLGYSGSIKSTSPASKGSSVPVHFCQRSGDSGATGSSLENSMETSILQSGMRVLSLSDSQDAKTDSSGERIITDQTRTGYKPSIEEWIRETNETAVVPEAIHSETRDVSSPTFTDASLSYSQMSDRSQEIIDSLKMKVDYLESKLEKESENNNDLRNKLQRVEKQLQEMQSRHNKSVNT